jgi:PBSX family phage terminase large subunit
MPRNEDYLMTGKTLTSLKRNCLELLQTLVGSRHFSYSLSKKEGRLFGRRIYFEGVNDARAEDKIRGMTLQGAYCDELTLFTEDFFKMLLSRISLPKAKVFATTNPDTPRHWLKVEYIDKRRELKPDAHDAIDLLFLEYHIDDNPFLDADFVRNLKKEHTGVFFERFVLGRWVIAEGRIYPAQANGQGIVPVDPTRRYTRYFVSVDYGTVNPFSAGLWGESSGVWYRIRELYYDSKKNRRPRTDDEHYKALDAFIGDVYVEAIIVDPSAASFITHIRRAGKYRAKQADNAVCDGIRATATAFNTGKIKVCNCCVDTIKEFSAYRWDPKKPIDAPIKEDDHAMDDIRYFVQTVLQTSSGIYANVRLSC